jgi:hypothetical protein
MAASRALKLGPNSRVRVARVKHRQQESPFHPVSAKTFFQYLFLGAIIAAAIATAVLLSDQPLWAVVGFIAAFEVGGALAMALKLDWTKKPTSNKDLRIFSVALGTLLTVLAWFAADGPGNPAFWPLQGAGIAIAVLGLIIPILIRPIQVVWNPPAENLLLGLTQFALVLTYYLPVLVTGVLMRLMGKDPLDRGFDKDAPTYWKKRDLPEDKSSEARFERYRRQF